MFLIDFSRFTTEIKNTQYLASSTGFMEINIIID